MALAACMLHQPKLLLLDEPTAGVDPKARRDFWDEIHRLSEEGLTVLVTTHYMDEAERCDRIVYILNGKLVARGTVARSHRAIRPHHLRRRRRECARGCCRICTARRVWNTSAFFGAALHVSGHDRAALEQTLARYADGGLQI